MNLTKEQEDILNSIPKYKTVKINAFAGTGKTTMLNLIAQKYANKKILYLAFNNAIKSEASLIFPNNTAVKTTHGLAFSAIKKYTKIDLNSLVNYRAIDISKKFEITYNQAIKTLKIFENFCNNTQDEISNDDIEHKTAKKMFNQMLIGVLKPSHSFYLKYYYLLLSKEQIPQFNYDIIMLDEAQDTNSVTLGISEALSSKVKIFVGDKHQQIYSFRGSKNALNKMPCDKEFYLSKSFRFTNNIAQYANILLKNFKNEKIEIKGSKISSSIITNSYISRTNAQLIFMISKRIENKKPYVTIRDPDEIFSLSIEVYYLLNNQKDKIKRHGFLKDFDDEDELFSYAKEVDDFELKTALKVVKEYADTIFEYRDISRKFYKAWKNRSLNGFEKRIKEILFLTTAHTSKGLEWDRVIIADDFNDFADLLLDLGCSSFADFQKSFETLLSQELMDEFNLFYVAITRAKKVLIKDSQNFHYLMSSNIEKLIDTKIKEQEILQSSSKNIKLSKMDYEDKVILKKQKNIELGKAKNSGLKWTLEDKIKLNSLFKKNIDILQIALKLERTPSAILGELLKNETINKSQQTKLSKLLKENKKASKSVIIL